MHQKYLSTSVAVLALAISNSATAGSKYTINLDSDFIKTFSSLGYKIQARQGCQLHSGSWTHNNSSEQSVLDDKSHYILTTSRCKKDPGQNNRTRDVRYVEVKFNKKGKPTHSCKFNIKTGDASATRSFNVNMFNCDRAGFYKNFLASQANDNLTATLKNIPNEKINEIAPTTYLCDIKESPETQDTRPFKVEDFLNYVDYYNTNDELVKHKPAPTDLSNQDGYLKSADKASLLGEQDVNNAPYYIRIKSYAVKDQPSISAGFVDIQYWNFYGLNAPQFFRLGGDFVSSKNFVWKNFAYHEGDWEHITVRVNDTYDKILGVFYAGHGGGHWVAGNKISYDAGHPKAYSACNSHASNEKKEIFNEESIAWEGVNIGSVCGIWLKAIDNGSHSTIPWTPWKNNNTVRLDDPNTAPAWINYQGQYGPDRVNDAVAIVGQGGNTAACLKSFSQYAPSKLKNSGGPKNPNYQSKFWSKIE
tara:strand:- start:39279 stop:40703 length:1425 start_codon:yes stop_codon:yes gene_type:complete